MRKRVLLSILLAAAAAAMVFAETTLKITFENNTGYTIKELYVSPTSHDDWYDNLLVEGEVPTGKSVDIQIPEYDIEDLVFDLMAVDTEGDSYSKYEVDLSDSSNRTVEFTFDDYEENANGSANSSNDDYNAGYMEGYRDAFREAYSQAYKEGFKAGLEEAGNN